MARHDHCSDNKCWHSASQRPQDLTACRASRNSRRFRRVLRHARAAARSKVSTNPFPISIDLVKSITPHLGVKSLSRLARGSKALYTTAEPLVWDHSTKEANRAHDTNKIPPPPISDPSTADLSQEDTELLLAHWKVFCRETRGKKQMENLRYQQLTLLDENDEHFPYITSQRVGGFFDWVQYELPRLIARKIILGQPSSTPECGPVGDYEMNLNLPPLFWGILHRDIEIVTKALDKLHSTGQKPQRWTSGKSFRLWYGDNVWATCFSAVQLAVIAGNAEILGMLIANKYPLDTIYINANPLGSRSCNCDTCGRKYDIDTDLVYQRPGDEH